MRRKTFVAACLFVIFMQPALSGTSSTELARVGIDLPANARLPTEAVWKDERGSPISLATAIGRRPSLMIFSDFTCTTLCGPLLSMVASAMSESKLSPTHDFRILVLSLDPKDNSAQASRLRQEQIGDTPISRSIFILRGDKREIQRAAVAVGFRFSYDAEHDQFAHPAAVYALTADGRVSRVLSGLGLTSNDLTLALVEAGSGAIGSWSQRASLLCYGFDPATGVYTLSIYRALVTVSIVTILILAGAIYILSRCDAQGKLDRANRSH
jgi:protein SCO1/2